ncbi:hypothetical protein RLDS_04300 [Sphingobium lactosutens DS20]|uniref:Uncharacterized protein n=1 Tax=Sphingobium lactosutens DS20 TaxID=1331060 RepID=T0J5C2_9SPHN|nr:hypothetical protein RLDS_04300 [Sphingobium lactosutens DS20]
MAGRAKRYACGHPHILVAKDVFRLDGGIGFCHLADPA